MKCKEKARKAIFILAAVAAFAVFATGCATVRPAVDDEALEIINMINSGSAVELTELSADSFLFDTEILHGSSIISSLWKGLAEAGLNIQNPVIVESHPVTADDKDLFGMGVEIDAFFSKYVPPNSMFFRIGADDASYAIILGPVEKKQQSIIAFGGPYK